MWQVCQSPIGTTALASYIRKTLHQCLCTFMLSLIKNRRFSKRVSLLLYPFLNGWPGDLVSSGGSFFLLTYKSTRKNNTGFSLCSTWQLALALYGSKTVTKPRQSRQLVWSGVIAKEASFFGNMFFIERLGGSTRWR